MAEPGLRGSSLSLALLRCTEQGRESRETPRRREVALTGWGLLEKRLPLVADSLSQEEPVRPVPGDFALGQQVLSRDRRTRVPGCAGGRTGAAGDAAGGGRCLKAPAEAVYSPSSRHQEAEGSRGAGAGLGTSSLRRFGFSLGLDAWTRAALQRILPFVPANLAALLRVILLSVLVVVLKNGSFLAKMSFHCPHRLSHVTL